MRPYNVVVWGATGFTGKLVCEHIVKDYQGKIKWAIAGRSKEKLEAVRADLAKINSAAVADLDLLVADIKDRESVTRVTAATSVLLTTAGPYARIGRPVVEACVDTATHYCDLTGEPNFIRGSIDDLHGKAREKEVRIVHCCGFDSVPSEMTTLMAADYLLKHGKKIGESMMVVEEAKGGASGGTIESGVNMVAADPGILSKMAHPYFLVPELADKPLDQVPDQGTTVLPRYSKTNKRWSGPFIMGPVNEAVVRRSNALLGYGDKMKYQERMPASSYFGALIPSAIYLGAGAFMYLAAKMPFVRNLAPKPGSGPSREAMETGRFLCKVYASSDEPEGQAPLRVEAAFGDKHRDPGYLGTSRMILEAALTMALDADALARDPYASKNPGGVLTPASAMGLVFLERLKKAGFDAEVKEATA